MPKPTARTTDRLDSPSMTKVTHEVVNITPELAETWLARNLGNRNLRETKVATLARDISRGEWRQTGEAIKFDWNGRLIDGQHRLHAIIAAGVAARMLVIRGLDPEAQKFIDTGAKRSAADAIRMAGGKTEPNIVAAAIRLILGIESGAIATIGSRIPEITHADALSFHEGREDALAAAALAARRVTKVTGASPTAVATFAFLSAQKDPEASFRFLSDLENMRTKGAGDPLYTLIVRLRNIGMRAERTSAIQQVFYFMRAWNAWRTGKTLRGLKDSTQAGPAPIPEIV